MLFTSVSPILEHVNQSWDNTNLNTKIRILSLKLSMGWACDANPQTIVKKVEQKAAESHNLLPLHHHNKTNADLRGSGDGATCRSSLQ
jgi:hypothetical protein